MWRARVSAGTVALTTFFVGAVARAECTKDLDCAGEQICEAGQCTEPKPSTAASAVAPPVVGAPRVISVESPPVQESPRFERRSVPLIAGGAIAAVAGLIGLGVGVLSSGATCYRELGDEFKVEHCERSPDYVAYAVGGILFAGGIPMMIIGGKKVPAEPEARVTSWVSPQGGGLVLKLSL